MELLKIASFAVPVLELLSQVWQVLGLTDLVDTSAHVTRVLAAVVVEVERLGVSSLLQQAPTPSDITIPLMEPSLPCMIWIPCFHLLI